MAGSPEVIVFTSGNAAVLRALTSIGARAMRPVPVEHRMLRFVRFRVRALMLFTLAVGVCLGWAIRNSRITASASALGHAGNHINYVLPAWARWPADAFGVDLFGHADGVTLFHCTDATLDHVACLKDLEELKVCASDGVTERGLARLRSLTKLHGFELADRTADDSWLPHVGRLTALRS